MNKLSLASQLLATTKYNT